MDGERGMGWDARAPADTGGSRLIPRRSVPLFWEIAGMGLRELRFPRASDAPVGGSDVNVVV